MTKLFILVHPGKAERSMYAGEYKTKFYKSGKGKHIRPHLIEEVEALEYDGVHHCRISMSNGGVLVVEETAEQVLEQIEAIECPQLEDPLSTEPPPIEYSPCRHKNFVPGNHGSRGRCPDCGWQGWLDDAN